MKRSFPILAVLVFAAVLGFASTQASPAAAASKCVHLVNRPEGMVLVNLCNACRQVGIERRRPSSPAPISRTYILPAKGKAPLTLQGNGLTRVTWEDKCPSAREDAQVEAERQDTCVTLTRTRDGKPGLLNACRACRIAAVEVTQADGKKIRHLKRILGGTFEGFDPEGAVQGRVVEEMACPK